MKNLFLLGSLSFSLAFSLGLMVEKNVYKSAAIGGIATISTLGSAFILEKKGINIASNEQEYNLIIQKVNEFKKEINSLNLERDNLQNTVTNLQNEKRKIDLLIEEQTHLKVTIEQEYNLILEKIRKEEIDSFIEQNTLYSQNLTCVPKDFLSIYHYNVNNFRSQIPRNNWGSYWNSLGHGINILSEPENLLTYFALYGSSHYYKISYLLDIFLTSNIFQSKYNINIEIIDYGCGQALGTTCFIDYLKQNNYTNIKIDAITLIEPSKASLSRGILHINHLGFDLYSANIKLINKGLQELNNNDLLTSNQNIKLHIFSNILDITGFEIENLANTIKESQSGINYFLCVSPTDKNNRIQQFFTFWSKNGYTTVEMQLSSEDLYKETWKFKSNQFKLDKIHRVQKLFYVNLEKFIDF